MPRDLETICLKCLEKSPKARYASAAALRDDVQAHLDGRPIAARPVSLPVKVLKWTRRRPKIAGLLLSLAGAVALGAAGVAYQFVQADTARRDAVDKGDWGDRQAAASPGLAQLWTLGDWTKPARSVEHGGSVWCVAFHPDGTHFVTGGADGTVRFWNADGTRRPGKLQHVHRVNSIAYTKDGTLLVAGCGEQTGPRAGHGEVQLWHVATREHPGPPHQIEDKNQCNLVHTVAVHPDGRQFAAAFAGQVHHRGTPAFQRRWLDECDSMLRSTSPAGSF